MMTWFLGQGARSRFGGFGGEHGFARNSSASRHGGNGGDFKPRSWDGEHTWGKATFGTTCESSASRSRPCAKSWARSPSHTARLPATLISSRRFLEDTFAS